MVRASVTLNHPHAAALLEGFFICIYSFLYIPSLVWEKFQAVFNFLSRIIPFFKLFLRFCCPIPGASRLSACSLRTCGCSVEDAHALYVSPQPSIASQLQEWSVLRASVKSAFISECEANNSIVHVAMSLLQSSCALETSEDRAPTLFLQELCDSSLCCRQLSFTQRKSAHTSEVQDSISTSLLIQESGNSSVGSSARTILRELLKDTRLELTGLQSHLQQPAHGFDSWQHVAKHLNPFHSQHEPHRVDTSAADSKRSALHRRMCRINKWHLLLRLHHLPWLRHLRKHALVHPPSQPHLAWRCSTLLLSSQMLSTTAAEIKAKMSSDSQPSTLKNNPATQELDAEDSLDRSISALGGAVGLHAVLLSYLQSERLLAADVAPQRAVGCGCCPCCPELPCKKQQKNGNLKDNDFSMHAAAKSLGFGGKETV